MITHDRPRLVLYFVLVFAAAVPIIGLGLVIPAVPVTPKNGPVTDLLLAFIPMTMALVFVHRRDGVGGVTALLRRSVDWRSVGRGWWPVVALLMPLITLSTFGAMSLAGESNLADTAIPWSFAPVLFVIFLAMAAGEEIGWLGYVMDPLQRRFGALGACVVFSIPWLAAHIPSILMMGQGWGYIAGQFFASVGLRIIWLWVYNNNGRSILPVIVMHALANVTGTYFQQKYDLVAILVAAVGIVAIWGAATMTRKSQPAATVTS